MANDTVVGLVSWGREGCGVENFPVIYANIANYVTWIDDKIDKIDNNSSSTVFETAHPYSDNTDETKVLSIPNAQNLEVTISGSLESNFDFIYITDENGNETRYTGVLDENIKLSGSSITVRFVSDTSVTDEGAIVTIAEASNTETSYETAHPYADNTEETKVLSIPNAQNLEVTISGSLESNFDFIYITDDKGNETQYTGELNANIKLSGSSITVRFVSDTSVTDEGAIVTIAEASNTETSYETAHPYADNTEETKVLSIPNVEEMLVLIRGQIENNFDFIYITDENGTETRYTGVLDEQIFVPGSSITVRFESDSSISGEGAIVELIDAALIDP